MAQPKFRAASTKVNQTTSLTELTPTAPLGVEVGDLVFLFADSYNANTTTSPVITVPTTTNPWNVLVPEYVESAEQSRSLVIAWKIWASSDSMGTWKTASVAGNSFNTMSFCYEKGTFSKSNPIPANSGWVKGAKATKQTMPTATAPQSECMALLAVASPSSPKEPVPAERWSDITGGLAKASMFIWDIIKTGGVSSGETTPADEYKKTGTQAGAAILIIIAPAGSFHTQSVTQSQSTPLVQRGIARLLSIASQSQSSSLIRTPARILSATAKQVVSLQLGVLKQGEVTQTQVVSLAHSVIRNLPAVPQEQTSFVKREPERKLMAAAKQALTTLAAKTIFLPTVTQEQNIAVGAQNERIMRATQAQVALRGGSKFTRTLSTTQSQSLTIKKALVKIALIVTQTQKVAAGITKFVFAEVKVKQVVSMSFKNFRKIGEIFAKVFGNGTESNTYGEVED